MEIEYLGHASFRIKSKKAVVVADPYDPEMVGMKFPAVSADIVSVSHNHADHNCVKLVKGDFKVFDMPGEYEYREVSLVGIASFHDNKKGELRGENTIFVIETDGIRIAHLGDLGHILPEKTVSEMGKIDVLMIPVGGEYTIGPNRAVEVVKLLEPSVILPMHYKTGEHNKETFSALHDVSDFISVVGIEPERMPKLILKKDLITEDQRLILLEKR